MALIFSVENDVSFSIILLGVGVYSAEERKQRIQRFLEKRRNRVWTKRVKYDVRKVRIRIQIVMYIIIITSLPHRNSMF